LIAASKPLAGRGKIFWRQLFPSPPSTALKESGKLPKVPKSHLDRPKSVPAPLSPIGKLVNDGAKDGERTVGVVRLRPKLHKHAFPFVELLKEKL